VCMYVSRLEIACDSEEFEICGCIYVPGRSYAASAEPANSPEAFFFFSVRINYIVRKLWFSEERTGGRKHALPGPGGA